jgi:hypothetical protein
MAKSLPAAGREMSNECQNEESRNSTLSGLTVIKAEALSYSIEALKFL